MGTAKTAAVIANLAQENAELRRALGDIYLFMHESRFGRKNLSMKNEEPIVGIIFQMLVANQENIEKHWNK